jgi:hypothetical protein
MLKKNRLSFSIGNAKLGEDTAIFSLPASWSCPGCLKCAAKADRVTGKITDGKGAEFRCYAASGENLFPNIRKSRWHNFDLLRGKTKGQISEIIFNSIPKNKRLVRIHSSGDFFSQTYFDAWLDVANRLPDVIFYTYTKSLPFVIARKNQIPSNFRVVASKGGKFDSLISKFKLKFAEVVFSKGEARKKGLKIDKTDKMAWSMSKKNLGLLLHGTQSAKTPAAKAWYKIKKTVGGYTSDYFKHYNKQGK